MIDLKAEREAESRRVCERNLREKVGLPLEGESMKVLPLEAIGALVGLPFVAGLCLKSYEVVTTVVANWAMVAEFYQSLPKGGDLP